METKEKGLLLHKVAIASGSRAVRLVRHWIGQDTRIEELGKRPKWGYSLVLLLTHYLALY